MVSCWESLFDLNLNYVTNGLHTLLLIRNHWKITMQPFIRVRKFQERNPPKKRLWILKIWFQKSTNVCIALKEKCSLIKAPILSSYTWKLIIGIFSCKINSWRRKNYQQLCCVACARNSMLPRKMKLLNISRINIGPKKKDPNF